MIPKTTKVTFHIEAHGESPLIEAFIAGLLAILKNPPPGISVDKNTTGYRIDDVAPSGQGVM